MVEPNAGISSAIMSQQKYYAMSIESKSQWKKLLGKARHGDAEAQWEAGFYYDEGLVNQSGQTIVKPNPKKALSWFLLSAEQGNEGSQLALANALSTGAGTKRDFKRAIYWAKKAVKKGSFAAAHNLGSIYRDLKKPKLSFTWYKHSVQMGDYDSLLEVGLCHLFGYGTKQDFELAQKSFKKISTCDLSKTCPRTRENALYWRSLMNLLGLSNGKKSIRKARKFLEEANRDDDHEQANEILNLIGKTKYIKTYRDRNGHR